MVNPKAQEEAEAAKKEVQELKEELEKSEFQKERARDQLESMAEQMSKLEQSIQAKGLELVVSVDVSGSMENALGHLVETLSTISKTMPKISPYYSVGIVAYRHSSADGKALQIFPLQQIQKESVDHGKSFGRLTEFLSGLKAQNGLAPLEDAVKAALPMFNQSDFSGHQIFLLLGDVGPYENDWNDLVFDERERQNERRIIKLVNNWLSTNNERSVVSLFSGQLPDASWSLERIKYRESLRFFRELALETGFEQNFTTNPGKMLALMLTAIVEEREE